MTVRTSIASLGLLLKHKVKEREESVDVFKYDTIQEESSINPTKTETTTNNEEKNLRPYTDTPQKYIAAIAVKTTKLG